MSKYNSDNLYLRYGYHLHMREALGLDAKTIHQAVAAIAEFDAFNAYRDYLDLGEKDAMRFKEWLIQRPSKADGKRLARSTVVHRLGHVQAYLRWVKTRKNYGNLDPDLIDYLTPSRRMVTAAKKPMDRIGPRPAVVGDLIRRMPSDTFLERRDRALIAFLYLTGVRDGVIPQLRLAHINVDQRFLDQDGEEVGTKFGKTMRTFFFPIPDDIRQIVIDWIAELRAEGCKDDAPIFSAGLGSVRPSHGRGQYHPLRSAHAVRAALRKACDAANIDYFYPHMIRKTLAQLGDEVCQTRRQLKAWSQNLGHESLATTEASYSKLALSDVQTLLQTTQDQNLTELFGEVLRLAPDQRALVEDVVKRLATHLIGNEE